MNRHVAFMAALIMWIFVCEVSQAVTYSYSITDLGTLGGSESCAYGISDGGQVVGWAYTTGGINHAFLYSDSTMHDLGTLGGTSGYSFAYGINDSGQVVGQTSIAGGANHACLYSGSTMYDLGTLGGTSGFSFAYDVNQSGQVAGGASTTDSATAARLPLQRFGDDRPGHTRRKKQLRLWH